MTAEVKLQPGWLLKDVQKAAQRLTEWSKLEERRSATALTGRGKPGASSKAISEGAQRESS